MAIRFDAAADYLSRTANLPGYDPVTWCAWVYISTDTDAVASLFVLTNGTGTTFDSLQLSTDGTTLRILTQNGSTSGTNLSTGTWYHLAYTRSGNTHLAYINGVLDITRSDANVVTVQAMGTGGNSAQTFNGLLHSIKIWDGVALSAAEIAQEMQTNHPQRFANLHIWSPTFDGTTERARDYSGNGYNWTENGTLADEAPPPISWGASPIVMPIVTTVAGGIIGGVFQSHVIHKKAVETVVVGR